MIHTKTLKELSTLLQSKEISATELATHYLDRIEASDLNAFLHIDPELSLAQAAKDQDVISAQEQVATRPPVLEPVVAHRRDLVQPGRACRR